MRKLTSEERAATQELRIQRIKDAKRRYVENNPEKRNKSFNDYWKNKKAEDPEAFKRVMIERYHQYKNKDKEAYLAKKRIYEKSFRSSDKESLKNRRAIAREKLLSKYGLTTDSYQKMLIDQSGKCALCEFEFGVSKVNIDHCHERGHVRGLLCNTCNLGLGYHEKMNKMIPNLQDRITKYLK